MTSSPSFSEGVPLEKVEKVRDVQNGGYYLDAKNHYRQCL